MVLFFLCFLYFLIRSERYRGGFVAWGSYIDARARARVDAFTISSSRLLITSLRSRRIYVYRVRAKQDDIALTGARAADDVSSSLLHING